MNPLRRSNVVETEPVETLLGRLRKRYVMLGAISVMLAAASSAAPLKDTHDLRFFEGWTESVSTVKITMQKPFVSRSIGRGTIRDDGSLDLVQQVTEEGRRRFDRRWQIRQVAAGRYVGTMSEANSPIVVQRVGDRYVFRFSMKGNLSVEEWIIPDPNRLSAHTKLTVRKFGIAVGHADGWIRQTNTIALGRAATNAQ